MRKVNLCLLLRTYQIEICVSSCPRSCRAAPISFRRSIITSLFSSMPMRACFYSRGIVQTFCFCYEYRNKIILFRIKKEYFYSYNYFAGVQNSISIIQPTQLPNTLYTGTVFATLIVMPAKRGQALYPSVSARNVFKIISTVASIDRYCSSSSLSVRCPAFAYSWTMMAAGS